MSISLDTAGSLVITSSGTAGNSYKMTISAPSAITANRAISIIDPGSASTLRLGTKPTYTLSANAAADTLTAAQSGYQIWIPAQAQAQTVTLPAVQAGLEYNFVMQGTAGQIVAIQGPANLMAGNLIVSAGAAAANALVSVAGNRRQVNFTATAVVGDNVRIVSDGVNWYASGQSSAAAGLAFA
jgi:hypothetical protein